VIVLPEDRMVVIPYRADVAAIARHGFAFDYEGHPCFAVPLGEHESRLLRNLGIDVPAPISAVYNWPGPAKPFEAQRKTAELMTLYERAYVLNGMGTGKTRAALWALDYMMREGMIQKALVLAPLSTLHFVWKREAFVTLPSRHVVVVHGTAAKRKLALAEEADIYVMNHDGLRTMYDHLLERPDIDCLVIDELAVFRNGQATRTKLAAKLSQRMKRVYGLTGSPIPNGPTDAWAQARIVTPATTPRSYRFFEDEVTTKISAFKRIPKQDAIDKVYNLLQPSVRFTLDDVVELPETVELPKEVALSAAQKRAYDRMRLDLTMALKEGQVTAVNEGVLLQKLLQISCGWVYTSEGTVGDLEPTERLEAVLDHVQGTQRKAIVFAPFVHTVEKLASYLRDHGFDPHVIHGGTPKSQRDEAFQQFQYGPEHRPIVAHPGTMAHGLTLTAADTIIWAGPVPNLETWEQANARITRIGQKHKQLVVYLHATPAERKVYKRLREKQQLQGALLEMLQEGT